MKAPVSRTTAAALPNDLLPSLGHEITDRCAERHLTVYSGPVRLRP